MLSSKLLKPCVQLTLASLLLLLGATNQALAQDVQNSTEVSTPSQNTAINSSVLGNAQDWHLTPTEWAQYVKQMQGPDGKYYPQLTPAAVLGINAQTPEDKKHFAEIVAQEEHDKLARELSFDNAVHQALLRLYPEEPLIQPFDLSPFNPVQPNTNKKPEFLQAGDHLVLFTDPNASLDILMVPLLLKALQHYPSVVLDVYCTGKTDDNAIRSWAKSRSIPMDLVAKGRITLNHENGQLAKVEPAAALPYLVRVRSGQSQPVSPWSLA
jgi:integrating conjugative element protein (TIGR03759 family)